MVRWFESVKFENRRCAICTFFASLTLFRLVINGTCILLRFCRILWWVVSVSTGASFIPKLAGLFISGCHFIEFIYI